jgi:hypothetical protein
VEKDHGGALFAGLEARGKKELAVNGKMVDGGEDDLFRSDEL